MFSIKETALRLVKKAVVYGAWGVAAFAGYKAADYFGAFDTAKRWYAEDKAENNQHSILDYVSMNRKDYSCDALLRVQVGETENAHLERLVLTQHDGAETSVLHDYKPAPRAKEKTKEDVVIDAWLVNQRQMVDLVGKSTPLVYELKLEWSDKNIWETTDKLVVDVPAFCKK